MTDSSLSLVSDMNSSLGVLELSIMGLAVRNQMRLIGQHYDR